MNKTKSIVSGKKAYVAPVSYCLTVSGNIICAVSTTYSGNNHEQVDFGVDIQDLDLPELTTP